MRWLIAAALVLLCSVDVRAKPDDCGTTRPEYPLLCIDPPRTMEELRRDPPPPDTRRPPDLVIEIRRAK